MSISTHAVRLKLRKSSQPKPTPRRHATDLTMVPKKRKPQAPGKGNFNGMLSRNYP